MRRCLLIGIMGLCLSTFSFAEEIDLAATKWTCTTNTKILSHDTIEDSNPVEEQIVKDATGKNNAANTQDARTVAKKLATNSLANAFAQAVKECKDCNDIHCVRQK